MNKGRFTKGNKPWNYGLKGIHLSPETEFKKGDLADANHHSWKGVDAGYVAKHQWIRRKYGKADSCEHCGVLDAKKYEWANISKSYKRDISDWIKLCTACHHAYDGHGLKNLQARKRHAKTA